MSNSYQIKTQTKEHFWKRIGKTQETCLCGCGKICKRLYVKGHFNKGKTKETSISLMKTGIKSSKTKKNKYQNGELIVWNKGLTKETDERVKKNSIAVSKSLKQSYVDGLIHPMLNKKHTNKSKKIIRRKRKKQIITNKQKENISKTLIKKYKKGEIIPYWLNKKQTKESNLKRSKKLKGKNNPFYGKKHTQETKNKLKESCRKATINRIVQQGKFICYNEKSIPFFEELNNQFNMEAYFGKEEYKIIGYSLDFYSPKFNLVIEWDEKYHYTKGNKLQQKDKIRQNNIKKHLNCKFIRIKEWENLTNYKNKIIKEVNKCVNF
jgi:very-short-patch-repair endonuclease